MFLFLDSFDHYATGNLLDKYQQIGDDAIRTAGQARTGIGCVQITSGAFGPSRTVPQKQEILVASAYYSSGSGLCLLLGNNGGGSTFFQGVCVETFINGDGSISIRRGSSGGDAVLGTSAPGVFNFNSYNAVALQATIGAAGTAKAWCNGVLVLDLVGVNTRNEGFPSRTYIDAFGLYGPGGNGQTAFHDDCYVLDCTASPNDSYLGALKIYAQAPDADVSVSWTPSAGVLNFENVDEIPPVEADFNSSSTVGQVDQYAHPLNVDVPANSQIFGVQHVLMLQIDSGARSVASNVEGHENADSVALSNGFVFYPWAYDTNPDTGASWVAGDFPVAAGPDVTA